MMTLTPPTTPVRPDVQEQALWAVGMRPISADAHRPDWLVLAQQSAQNALGTIGFPSKKDEAWRHISLDRISRQTFQPVPVQPNESVAKKLVEAYFYPETAQTRRVILNGTARVEDVSNQEGLPEGVFLGTLNQFLQNEPDLDALDWVKSQLAKPDADALTHLNTAQLSEVKVLVIPKGMQLAAPVQVVFFTAEVAGVTMVNHPRLMVYVGDQAQASVLVQFAASVNANTSYWTNGVLDVYAGERAHLDMVVTQAETLAGLHTLNSRVVQKGASDVRMFSMQLGGHLARHQIDWLIDGEYAHGVVDGLTVSHGETENHHFVTVRHAFPNSRSEQLFKSVLGGTSRAGFDGTIEIAQDAQNTDASQLNKNLLLSGDARAITRPQLRINADDVRCSHGATVGQLSEAELFYLQSRGIQRDVAMTTLTFGFAEDLVEKIPMVSLRKHLKALVHHHLDSELGLCIHRKEAR